MKFSFNTLYGRLALMTVALIVLVQVTLRVVVDHTRPVIRPIEMTGLDDLLALYTTLDLALHHAGPRP